MDKFNLSQELLDFAKPFYCEAHRHYHNWDHITEMLSHSPYPLSLDQKIAILFHDIVYVPGAPTGLNEQLSYNMVKTAMKVVNGKIAVTTQREVTERTYVIIDDVDLYLKNSNIESIILSTIDHRPLCKEAELVLDMDLYRLSVPLETWMIHEADIRKEYAHIDSIYFYDARGHIMAKFAQRPQLFYTPSANHDWAEQAQANLKHTIKLCFEQQTSYYNGL